MKVKKTYLSGCVWCKASGIVPNPFSGTATTINCPVCNGSKVITVTEEYFEIYAVRIPEPIDTTCKADIDAIKKSLDNGIIRRCENAVHEVLYTKNFDDYSRLKEYRKFFKLTIRDLSKLSGVSISIISRMENKKMAMYGSYLYIRNAFIRLWKERNHL